MKQNPRPVVGEVPETSGIGLDELGGAVKAFGTGVGDSVHAVDEQTRLVAAQHFHDL